jgi:hypothetical protein
VSKFEAAGAGKNRERLSSSGFTLIEVMVSALVLVIGLIFTAQFFASAAARVGDASARSVLNQRAGAEIEVIRALPYENVGTTTGHPQGSLPDSEDITVDGVDLRIQREVVYVTDGSYSGPYPANYRRATVTVTALDYPELAPVTNQTFVAGGTPGGTLDITVVDTTGAPVANAQLTITNTHLVPNVNVSSAAIRTDVNGRMIIPGLPPDATPNYRVAASKLGYNSAYTDPLVVVNDGLPYTVVQLVIDRLSTMVIHLESGTVPIPGKDLAITGPWAFSEQHTTDGNGLVTLADLPFSTDINPYVINLLTGQGFEPVSSQVALAPGTTEHVILEAVPITTTTTLVPPTSTTMPTGTVLVTVRRQGNNNRIQGARVTIGNLPQQTTNAQGETSFSNVPYGTYPLTVTRNNYYPYNGIIVVDGNESVTIHIVRQ